MPDEVEQLKKRLAELSRRASARGCWVYSEFLDLAAQQTLAQLRLDGAPVLCVLDGGFDGAERRIACFGSGQLCRDERKAPICCVCITPLSQKFAEPLTHRDYLGALMALGIRRALLGDLVLSDGSAYLFCMDSICGFLTDELSRVKHTAVRCQVAQPPSCQAQTPPVTAVNVASGRLDAMVAAVFHLSRADSQRLFAQEKVFRNSRVCLAPDACAAEGEIISVRGFGRFVYEGVEKQTRSGRLRILVRR